MKHIEGITLLTIPETAEVLGLCQATIRRKIKTGDIPSIHLGRAYVKTEDICRILKVESIDLSRFSEE